MKERIIFYSSDKSRMKILNKRYKYAEIPDHGVRKLNAAHAIGGGPLIVETLENTYGVQIDNYARVDFNSMTDIVDALGGVDIEISKEEAKAANTSIKEMCKIQGKKYKENKLKKGGNLHLKQT